MMQIHWQDLTPEQFLKEYWQKKPLLIKNAFRDFSDPVDADELAGFAMEEEIESRIISQQGKEDWQVAHGPFSAFDQFGEQDWTLLVQATNNWSTKTHDLLTPFRFIPNWRIDDVMVSFSTPGGGVGPHLDQYDVFIIQGQGKRRWQVGLPDESLKQLLPHPDLKQVSDFTPVIDEITGPGDLLYIPPNHPHNGVALENSLNYSVGFQAPNNQELWSAFADKLLDLDAGTRRLDDPNRQLTENPEQLESKDIAQIKNFMQAQLDDETLFNDFIGSFLTQCHHAMEILVPVTPITPEQLDDILSEEEICFTPVSGIKSLIISTPSPCLYINGEAWALEEKTFALATKLAQSLPLTTQEIKSFTSCLLNAQLLTSVLNKGYWFIE
ncbi:cupin domain-containing protein [Thalassomonas actiniarum]|uniref:Cupin domain-containing protein n=1 Tax=Thalassomonas actiniarum TaxID=485447 RepID=A0AAE9YKX3_9GAMM|nr:cupin domain-containing protein [Thalassomonas actiniarum]WDD96673.1 cupin domain-containing protein [Thalassomonas actiniarum]